MGNQTIDPSYKALLRTSQVLGEEDAQRGDRERRLHPRLHVDAAEIQVDTDSWIFVINLSITGIAFYTNSEFTIAQEVTISADPGLKVLAKVVDIQPEGEDATALVGKFRVCCAFSDSQEGMNFLLRIKEHEVGHLESDLA